MQGNYMDFDIDIYWNTVDFISLTIFSHPWVEASSSSIVDVGMNYDRYLVRGP